MNPWTIISRRLRNNATPAEKYLWYALRQDALGVRFRRQEIIGQYIVDFVCYNKRLVVEVDGCQPLDNRDDMLRDAWLRTQGFTVLRFWNNEVMSNRDGVVEKIKECLA